jgi:putative aldouronate transport system permease protein
MGTGIQYKHKNKFTRDDLEITIIALPTIILLLVMAYLPLYGVILPFKDLKLYGASFLKNLFMSEWIGLKNFGFLFKSPDTILVIRNTVLYNVAFIVLGNSIAIILSIIFNEMNDKGYAKTCQTLLFLPHFLSYVVISYFAYTFLSMERGLFNKLLGFFGNNPISWYTEPKYWPFIITITHLWKGLGYSMVIYLAAIAGLDKTMYEAAVIDGSSKLQQALYITLPSLRTIITILLILALRGIFQANFGLFYNLPRASSALLEVTNVVDTFVYRTFLALGNIGMSSAAAMMQSMIGCVLMLGGNYLIRRVDSENALF